MDKERFERGLVIGREVLGAEFVDKALDSFRAAREVFNGQGL